MHLRCAVPHPLIYDRAAQRSGSFRRVRAAHPYAVCFAHAVRRMRQTVRHLAVIGEEQQSFRHAVEPTDREKAYTGVLHKLGDRRAAVRVAQRCNISAGLVEKNICMLLRQRKTLAVQ